MTSGVGDARVAAGAAVEMHVVEAQADLSLSISLLWCDALECSWGEKENKRSGARHFCGGEKQEKEKGKKKKRNETVNGWKWNERKKNNIKNKKS